MPATSTCVPPRAVRSTGDAVEQSARAVELRQSTTSVWRGFGWAFFGNLVYSACHWGMFILLARLGSPELVGQFALALAIGGPVVFVSNLQLRAIQASDAGWEHQFADYWCLRLVMAPLALLVIATVALMGNYSTEVSVAILVMGVAKVIESLSDICFGAIQRDNRLDLVGKSLAIKGPATLLMMGLLVWLTQSVAIGIGGIMVAWLFMFGGFDFKNVRRAISAKGSNRSVVPRWDWQHQKRLIAIGLPMGVSMGLLALTVGLPNILIERMLGERELGIFAALASLTWAGLPLINAMGQAVMPRLGQLFVAGEKRRLRRLVLGLGALGGFFGALGVLVVWMAGKWLVAPLYGEEYAEHVDVLIWLMGAASILYAVRFLADALTAMRCVPIPLVVQGMAALAVLVGGVLLVPHRGMVGMAQVLMLAFALRGILLMMCFWWRTGQLNMETTQ